MSIFKKRRIINKKSKRQARQYQVATTDVEAWRLYRTLMSDAYKTSDYLWSDLGEGMESISMLVVDFWKQRYVLDHNREAAFEFMTPACYWARFTEDDIEWASLEGLTDEALIQAHNLNAFYPSFIRRYENGVAEVEWQLIPDGRYWMDDEGFGRTNDVETPLYAMIDKNLNIIVKFRFIGADYDQLSVMRAEAEQAIAKNH